MRLVLSETDTGIWLQREGETPEEWWQLNQLAASGIWTCGPGTDDVLFRLRAIAGEIAPGVRHAWGGAEPGVGLGEFLRERPGEERDGEEKGGEARQLAADAQRRSAPFTIPISREVHYGEDTQM